MTWLKSLPIALLFFISPFLVSGVLAQSSGGDGGDLDQRRGDHAGEQFLIVDGNAVSLIQRGLAGRTLVAGKPLSAAASHDFVHAVTVLECDLVGPF